LRREAELPPGRVLVPGCGSGYDAFALADAGWAVTGLDISPTAAARFRALRDEHGLSPERAEIHIGDFFTFQPGAPFDLGWDYTFLCAIDPDRRQEWADKMHGLIRPGGMLCTLLFPVDSDDTSESTREDSGPPYRLHPEWVERLLQGRFVLQELERVTRSHPGRGGMEWLARWRRA
ncbi:MAG: methyltransferase, partial [Myxococcota bacterium]